MKKLFMKLKNFLDFKAETWKNKSEDFKATFVTEIVELIDNERQRNSGCVGFVDDLYEAMDMF